MEKDPNKIPILDGPIVKNQCKTIFDSKGLQSKITLNLFAIVKSHIYSSAVKSKNEPIISEPGIRTKVNVQSNQ